MPQTSLCVCWFGQVRTIKFGRQRPHVLLLARNIRACEGAPPNIPPAFEQARQPPRVARGADRSSPCNRIFRAVASDCRPRGPIWGEHTLNTQMGKTAASRRRRASRAGACAAAWGPRCPGAQFWRIPAGLSGNVNKQSGIGGFGAALGWRQPPPTTVSGPKGTLTKERHGWRARIVPGWAKRGRGEAAGNSLRRPGGRSSAAVRRVRVKLRIGRPASYDLMHPWIEGGVQRAPGPVDWPIGGSWKGSSTPSGSTD